MLQRQSEEVRACHEQAAEAKGKAEAAADLSVKADGLDMERRSLLLARSIAFTKRLGDFTATASDWLRKTKRINTDLTTLPDRLFDLLPVGLYVCDPDGLIRLYNRRAAELWGRSPKLDDPPTDFAGRTACTVSTAPTSRTPTVPLARFCEPAFPLSTRRL
jgi:PAS domain-containing protein